MDKHQDNIYFSNSSVLEQLISKSNSIPDNPDTSLVMPIEECTILSEKDNVMGEIEEIMDENPKVSDRDQFIVSRINMINQIPPRPSTPPLPNDSNTNSITNLSHSRFPIIHNGSSFQNSIEPQAKDAKRVYTDNKSNKSTNSLFDGNKNMGGSSEIQIMDPPIDIDLSKFNSCNSSFLSYLQKEPAPNNIISDQITKEIELRDVEYEHIHFYLLNIYDPNMPIDQFLKMICKQWRILNSAIALNTIYGIRVDKNGRY